MTGTNGNGEPKKKNPLNEIIQPFIDLVHAPRALMGINISYFIEGFVYFGMVGYVAMYFNEYVGLDDHLAGIMLGVLTWGITFSMFLFGGLADKWGVRRALVVALILMVFGRILLAGGPTFGLAADGMWSPVYLTAMLGILFIVLGYGMYQPAAYAAVKQFTSEKTAAMGFAMLYALMNLGGWLPTWVTPIRTNYGISGAYWFYVGVTVVGLILTFFILSRMIVKNAIEAAKLERQKEKAAKGEKEKPVEEEKEKKEIGDGIPGLDDGVFAKILNWFKNHPLADPKFAFFIFCLIPVQTLFAHNWLTLPMYVERAYKESWPWISINFEKAVNFNPLLIFILVPIVTALTQKAKVYNMMILGTFVMAAPTFLLTIGAEPWTLVAYLVIMTIGEAMWQPRFLQYAAEIAPEGRTGAYMGVAQFPWFMTKVVTSLYSGWFLIRYCPDEETLLSSDGLSTMNSEKMWLIYGFIAMSSTVMLILARGWVGKDFKTKAD